MSYDWIDAIEQRLIVAKSLQPRANTKRILESGTVPKDIAERAERMEGAHLVSAVHVHRFQLLTFPKNGNEMLPLWVGAVVRSRCISSSQKWHELILATQLAGNFAGIDNQTLNIASAAL